MSKEHSFRERLINRFSSLKDSIEESVSTPTKRRVLSIRFVDFIVDVLKYILVIGLSFVIIYPIIQQLSVAFRAPNDVNNPLILWIPEEFSVKNFEIARIALKYWESLKNTLMFSSGVAILQVIVAAITGYSFARLKFKGSNILFGLALFTIIVPQSMIALPSFLTFSKLKLLGKPVVLFLMAGLGMGIKSGIFIYLFRQFFRGVPNELEEAAYVDGATPFQVFYKVMLPNARGAIITVALLAFVWQWNDNYFTDLFVSGRNMSMPTLTTQLSGVVWGLQNALMEAGVWQSMGQDVTQNPLFTSMILNTCGILVMLPLLILYFFVQKLFVEGVERSGIVG